MSNEVVAAVSPVVDALEALGVPYSIGGSIASSTHGIARSTLDVDVVADLRLGHVAPLADALQDQYYLDRDAAEDAVRRRSMFNLVHLETMLKVDLYVLRREDFYQVSFERRTEGSLGDHEQRFFMSTPEDTVLHKLMWYRDGGQVAERQWNDILGVLKVQSDALDMEYLRHWASELDITELLQRALIESGR